MTGSRIDRGVRVVNLPRLQELVRELSQNGVEHWIEKITRSRVWVGTKARGGRIFTVYPNFPHMADQLVALLPMRVLDDAGNALEIESPFIPA